MQEFVILVGLLLVLLALGCPVAFAMIIASVTFLLTSHLPVLQLAQKIAGGVDSFPLLAIPMFLLAGGLMNTMGITDRIFTFAQVLVRHVTGGLGHVNVLASIIFAGMSGSAVADAGGLGTVEIKAMRDAGYDRDFSAAITGASAVIGPVIPPSITMVIYGFLAEESVGRLFLAGAIPGLLMGVSMMVLIYAMARLRIYECPRFPRAGLGEIWSAFQGAILPILAPVILLAGIISGVFTPTEAGVVVVLYVLLIGIVQLRFSFRHVRDAAIEAVRTTCATMWIIAASMIYGWIIIIQKVPDQVVTALSTHIDSVNTVFAFVIVTLLLFGMILEAIPVMLITVPTFIALGDAYQIDPVHLGVVVVVTMMIGSITPPVGLTLFTVMKVAGLPMDRMVRAIWPFYLAIFVVILATVYVPSVALWLPDLVFGQRI
jgi:TRAP-type transport system large permease protein